MPQTGLFWVMQDGIEGGRCAQIGFFWVVGWAVASPWEDPNGGGIGFDFRRPGFDVATQVGRGPGGEGLPRPPKGGEGVFRATLALITAPPEAFFCRLVALLCGWWFDGGKGSGGADLGQGPRATASPPNGPPPPPGVSGPRWSEEAQGRPKGSAF